MAVTVTNYGRFMESLLEGRVNLQSDELWTMLVTSGYVFNQSTHKFKSVVTNEVVGSGYAAGGIKTTFTAPVYDTPTKTIKVPSGNISWPSVTFTGVVGAVLYVKKTGLTATSWPLVSYIAFGESISRSANAFYLNWPASGAIRMQVP